MSDTTGAAVPAFASTVGEVLSRGLAPGDRVAAFGHNSDAYVLLYLGCAKAGLVHVTVNFNARRYELIYLLTQSEPRIASHKVPKSVHFVDELPKNASGKLLKRELRAALGGSPSAVGSAGAGGAVSGATGSAGSAGATGSAGSAGAAGSAGGAGF
jgi:acyl-CoA synthetase (AMP-forming)/AMP-acid ligase II